MKKLGKNTGTCMVRNIWYDIFAMLKEKDHVKNFLETLVLAIIILNLPAKKKKTTKYRF